MRKIIVSISGMISELCVFSHALTPRGLIIEAFVLQSTATTYKYDRLLEAAE
jgi:hypothetical protein